MGCPLTVIRRVRRAATFFTTALPIELHSRDCRSFPAATAIPKRYGAVCGPVSEFTAFKKCYHYSGVWLERQGSNLHNWLMYTPQCVIHFHHVPLIAGLSRLPGRENGLLVGCHNRNYNVPLEGLRSGLPKTHPTVLRRAMPPRRVSTENWSRIAESNRRALYDGVIFLFPGRNCQK